MLLRSLRRVNLRVPVPTRMKSSLNLGADVVVPKTMATSKAQSQAVPKSVGYWLLGMCGLVGGMVTIGGITRLTKSGLSMTDWKLTGSMPPMNYEEWMIEFDKYKQFPEYKQRPNMTLDEFKYIYFWEWGHRMFGRGLGVAFAIPFTYFWSRGMIPRSLYPRMGALFSLGGLQGLIGWWMVKSGLSKKDGLLDENNREIRVSPYRLATHLSMAFLTYTTLLWTALEIIKPTSVTLQSVMDSVGVKGFDQTMISKLKKIRVGATVNTALVAITVLSGAYVAGNDAGNAYNTFPKMGDDWIPEGMWTLEPKWRNLIENTATVQFDHRYLALSTATTITALFAYTKQISNGSIWKRVLPRYAHKALHAMTGMVFVQVGLGISTLLLYVPLHLAATHQLGSLVLLTFSTATLHSLRFVKLLKAGPVQQAMKTVATSVSKVK